MSEGLGKSHRTSLKDKDRPSKDRALEERRRASESLLRRQRGAALNARRKKKLLEFQKDAETGAPLLFTDEEMRMAVKGAVEALRTSEAADHLRHVRYLRYLLTDSEDPPLTLFAQLEVVPLLVEELTAAREKEIQSETLWALACLADGDLACAQRLLKQTSIFVPYLTGAAGYDLAELAAWLVRSLALSLTCDEQKLWLDITAVPLGQLVFACVTAGDDDLDSHVDASVTAAWSLCSLIAHSPTSRQELLRIPHFPTQLSNLLSLKNGRIVTEAAWLITYLVASDDTHLTALIQANVVSQLVKILKLYLEEPHPDLKAAYEVLTPVLRSLGNIAAGVSSEQVKELVDHENRVILTCMSECLSCDHRGIQKEACKTLSNIAAASDRSIVAAFVDSSILEKIIRFVGQSAFDIKREAAFVLANICFNTDVTDVEFLKFVLSQETKIIPGIVSLMQGIDVDTIKLGLDFTHLILENIMDGSQQIEEANGIDALDNLQFGDIPSDLQDLASYLVDTYFGEDYGLD